MYGDNCGSLSRPRRFDHRSVCALLNALTAVDDSSLVTDQFVDPIGTLELETGESTNRSFCDWPFEECRAAVCITGQPRVCAEVDQDSTLRSLRVSISACRPKTTSRPRRSLSKYCMLRKIGVTSKPRVWEEPLPLSWQ